MAICCNNNYLNGSDHRVIASYSGLHEECEVNIWRCVEESLEDITEGAKRTLRSLTEQEKRPNGVNTWQYLYGSCESL